MGEVIQNVLARGDVHPHVIPFLGGDLRETAFHQRLAGRHDLDHGSMAVHQILLDRADQGRRLHRGQQMAEEALLGGFEGRAGGGLSLAVQSAGIAGDVGGLHRRIEIIMDDGERPGVGVVDAGLLGGELVLDQFIFDAVIGEGAGRVETERAQVAG